MASSFSEGVLPDGRSTRTRSGPPPSWPGCRCSSRRRDERTGRVDDRNWEHVDLLPTIAETTPVSRCRGTPTAAPRWVKPPAATAKRFDRTPGDTVTIDGPAHFAAVLRGPAARPVLPDIPELALVGRAVTRFTVTEGGPTATVANLADYRDVRPDSGSLPALAYGTLPKSVRPGTPVAIAVNGTIGAVVLAVPDQTGTIRTVGLITDESFFVPGPNRLELFLINSGGTALQRMPTTSCSGSTGVGTGRGGLGGRLVPPADGELPRNPSGRSTSGSSRGCWILPVLMRSVRPPPARPGSGRAGRCRTPALPAPGRPEELADPAGLRRRVGDQGFVPHGAARRAPAGLPRAASRS